MASILTQAADAVATELNTKLAGWGYASTTAVRKNTTKFVLEELADLRVTVLPIASAPIVLSRTQLEWTLTIDIDVRKRTADDQEAEDEIAELAEFVVAHFLNPRPETQFPCMTVGPAVTVPSEDLQDKALFAVAARFEFKAYSSGESA